MNLTAERLDSDERSIEEHAAVFMHKNSGGRMFLRMTAMIDVIFLLLAFFVLTAKFNRPEGFLPAALPAVEAGQTKTGLIEPLLLRISPLENGCSIQIGADSNVIIEAPDSHRGLADLAGRLSMIMQQQNRNTHDPIEIECSDDVKWDWPVKIYNVLYGLGIDNITFTISE